MLIKNPAFAMQVARRPSPPAQAAMEQRWQLNAASAGQQLGTIALGAVNLVGVVALTFMLQVRGTAYFANCNKRVARACAAAWLAMAALGWLRWLPAQNLAVPACALCTRWQQQRRGPALLVAPVCVVQNPVNQLALARNGLLGIVGLMPFLQVRLWPITNAFCLAEGTVHRHLAAAACSSRAASLRLHSFSSHLCDSYESAPQSQAYAAAFFALPLFRSVRNAARNADIDRRNSTRQDALRLLANPDPLLRRKLAAAQAAARQNVITNR